jgi:23S rRNA (pseudouridine1915-N3)-methyltransferase
VHCLPHLLLKNSIWFLLPLKDKNKQIVLVRIKIVVIGKTTKGFVELGVDEYLKRLKRYIKVEVLVLPDVKNSKNLSVEQLLLKEEELLLAALAESADVVLLDERGRELSSIEFSQFLQTKMLAGSKELIIVVGGAYGVSNKIKERVKFQLSMSKFTFSHQMIRLILVEQIYRSMTILKGEPYHHE